MQGQLNESEYLSYSNWIPEEGQSNTYFEWKGLSFRKQKESPVGFGQELELS